MADKILRTVLVCQLFKKDGLFKKFRYFSTIVLLCCFWIPSILLFVQGQSTVGAVLLVLGVLLSIGYFLLLKWSRATFCKVVNNVVDQVVQQPLVVASLAVI